MSSSASLSLFPLILSKTPHEDIILLREFAFLCLKHYLVLGNFYNFAHTSTSKFSVTIGASPWRLHCLKITTTILELNQFWNLKKKKAFWNLQWFHHSQDFTSIRWLGQMSLKPLCMKPSFPLAVENQRK